MLRLQSASMLAEGRPNVKMYMHAPANHHWYVHLHSRRQRSVGTCRLQNSLAVGLINGINLDLLMQGRSSTFKVSRREAEHTCSFRQSR
jgi:hypothetical protein